MRGWGGPGMEAGGECLAIGQALWLGESAGGPVGMEWY